MRSLFSTTALENGADLEDVQRAARPRAGTTKLYKRERAAEAALYCCQFQQPFFTPNVAKPEASLSPATTRS